MIAFVLVLMAVGIYVALRYRQPGPAEAELQTATVARGDVSAIVSATGVLVPLTSVEVKSNVGGQVVELTVDEGDIVHAGQLLARIDPADQLSRLQQAQASLASARAQARKARQQCDAQPKLTGTAIEKAGHSVAAAKAALAQTKTATVPQKLAEAQANHGQAKATLSQTDSDLARQRALLAKGFVAKSQVEEAEQRRAVARAQMDTAESRIATVEAETQQETQAAQARVRESEAALESARASAYQVRTSREDVIQSEADVSRIAAEVDDARTQVEYTNIYAPRDGVVVKKYVEKGSIITAGRSSFSGSGEGIGILEIADVTGMLAQVDVDETDISQIKLGQKVKIIVDAYPDASFAGTVTRIAPKAVEDQNVVTVPVEVEFLESDPRLKPGLNATCDFIVQSKRNVLVVPKDAIQQTPKGATVQVIRDGEQQSRGVETGAQGDEFTEITSGLREGDRVVRGAASETTKGSGPTPGRHGPRMF